MLPTKGEKKGVYAETFSYINNDKIFTYCFFSFLLIKIDTIEMATSSTAPSIPIILVPAEQLTSINGGPAVTVKATSQLKKNVNFRDLVDSNVDALKNEVKALFTFRPREWLSAFRPNPKFPLFVLGDIDGFVALFMNNLATLLAVILGLKLVFEDDIIYGKIVPG